MSPFALQIIGMCMAVMAGVISYTFSQTSLQIENVNARYRLTVRCMVVASAGAVLNLVGCAWQVFSV